MASGIYKIKNKTNGHCYIGSAVNIDARWCIHKSDLHKNKHHSRHLQNAWNKYGEDTFEFRVIEYCFVFTLIPREQHYIDTLKPEYNMSPTAGSALGVKHSDESRANMSAWQKGKKLSPKHKAKLSAAKMGRKLSLETKAKMSAAHMGRETSPETKIKLSVWQIGKVTPKETREKISNTLMGHKYNLGHKHSDETKAKLSAASIADWVKRRLREALEQ